MLIKRNSNNIFDLFLGNVFDSPLFDSEVRVFDSTMRTDVIENDNEYILSVELAGFNKDQIQLEIEEEYLSITANSVDEKEENVKYIRKERSVKTLKRSFYVGDEIDKEKISASMENGILKVILPKAQQIPPKTTKITIN